MILSLYIIIFVAIVIVLSSIRVINQYEKGLVFTLGKFTGIRNPGLNFVVPVIQRMVVVDMRVRTTDIQKQQVMTKDNVPVDVNGVVFFKVNKVDDAIIKVQDYEYAIAQYAQTALRDVIGGMTLDTVLVERQQIGEEIRKIVDKETDQWGLDVQVIKLQDIEVPDDLKRIMSRQAAAEREKRAVVFPSFASFAISSSTSFALYLIHEGAVFLDGFLEPCFPLFLECILAIFGLNILN